MRRRLRSIALTSINLLLVAFVGILLTYLIVGGTPPFGLASPFLLIGLLVLCAIVAAILGGELIPRLQSTAEHIAHNLRNPHRLDRQSRQRVLAWVRAIWIDGILEDSLHREGPITPAPAIREKPDAVEDPWAGISKLPDQPTQVSSPNSLMRQMYDRAGGELLILGESGSGKSTKLLEVVRDLLSLAEQDHNEPLPIVLSLSSWKRRQPLEDWLCEELEDKYKVPHPTCLFWISHDQILPLLDDLDAVPHERRASCLEAINTYLEEHPSPPLVVCCQTASYVPQSLRLQHAIIVEPLTTQQIDDYLTNADDLQGLREAIKADQELSELATRPLLLKLMAQAYQGVSKEDVLKADLSTTRQQQVVAAYVQSRLQRWGVEHPYPQLKTISWLAWLGRQMLQCDSQVFHLERMQPDWLPENWARQLYDALTSKLFLGVLFGTAEALMTGIIFRHLEVGILAGLLACMCFLFFKQVDRTIWPAESVSWSWRRVRQNFARVVRGWLSQGLFYGLAGGLYFSFRQGSGIWLLLWTLLGLIWGLFMSLFTAPLSGLASGWSSDIVDERQFTKVNEGMRRSFYNSIGTGLIGGAVFGLPIGLGIWLLSDPGAGISFGLIAWLTAGILIGLSYGGIACIQHFFLRFVLCCAKMAPWNYPRFLDYAARRILLRKTQGGYMFIHRLVLEYFAAPGNKLPPSVP